jgi:hypothetical protein
LLSSTDTRVTVAALTALLSVFHPRMVVIAAAQEGNGVRPLIGLTHAFDSNVLSTSNASSADFVTRLTPGVEGLYGSRLARLVARYTVDIEAFTRLPAMNNLGGRHAASVNVRTTRSRRTTASIDSAYTRTNTPGELAGVAGVLLRRSSAERLQFHPALTRQIGRLMSGSIEYTFARDTLLDGGLRADSHTATVGLDRQFSRRNTLGVDYELRRMAFHPGDTPMSHVVRGGWSRPLTHLVDVELRAGMAVTDGQPAGDFLASLQHAGRMTEAAFTYTRTQTTLIGVNGVIDAQTWTASGTMNRGRAVTLRLSPSLSDMSTGGSRARAWRMAFDAEHATASGFLVRASYEFSRQGGGLFVGAPDRPLSRHLVQIGIVPPVRTRRHSVGF